MSREDAEKFVGEKKKVVFKNGVSRPAREIRSVDDHKIYFKKMRGEVFAPAISLSRIKLLI